MFSWLVGRVVRRTFARLLAGEVDAVLAGFDPDARFVFPGEHSFAADLDDHESIRAWFTRFAGVGLTFVIEDVLVAGPPWNMRVAVRFTDRTKLADGSTYENHGVQYLRMRWGRIRLDQIYVDTQALAAVDRELSAR
jgi:ketosteroid isomerase-like protein